MGNVPWCCFFFHKLPIFPVKVGEEGIALIGFSDFRNIEGVGIGKHFPVHMLAADDEIFILRQGGEEFLHAVERRTPSGAS